MSLQVLPRQLRTIGDSKDCQSFVISPNWGLARAYSLQSQTMNARMSYEKFFASLQRTPTPTSPS